VEKIQAAFVTLGDPPSSWDAEAWALKTSGLERLLAHLLSRGRGSAKKLARVVCLAGDVHYGFTAKLTFLAAKSFELGQKGSAVFAQLTSSAHKNETTETLLLHNIPSVATLYGAEHHLLYGSASNLAVGPSLQVGGTTVNCSGTPASVDVDQKPIISILNLPDWEHRFELLRGANVVDPDWEKPPTIAQPASGDRVGFLDAVSKLDYAHWYSARGQGRLLIGTSNLGEVTFSADGKNVKQQLWWRMESSDSEAENDGTGRRRLPAFPWTQVVVNLEPDTTGFYLDGTI
jgi:hypothetical protein